MAQCDRELNFELSHRKPWSYDKIQCNVNQGETLIKARWNVQLIRCHLTLRSWEDEQHCEARMPKGIYKQINLVASEEAINTSGVSMSDGSCMSSSL